MSALHELLLLWAALGGVGIVWWADRVMEEADLDFDDFARQEDLHLGG